MGHTFKEIEAAGKEHHGMLRFLNACHQSKKNNQPVRISAKLNSKECVVFVPVGDLSATISKIESAMRNIETKFGIEAGVIGEANKGGDRAPVKAQGTPQSK